jgi:hypothetical protein
MEKSFVITEKQVIDILNILGEAPTKYGYMPSAILQSLPPLEVKKEEGKTDA